MDDLLWGFLRAFRDNFFGWIWVSIFGAVAVSAVLVWKKWGPPKGQRAWFISGVLFSMLCMTFAFVVVAFITARCGSRVRATAAQPPQSQTQAAAPSTPIDPALGPCESGAFVGVFKYAGTFENYQLVDVLDPGGKTQVSARVEIPKYRVALDRALKSRLNVRVSGQVCRVEGMDVPTMKDAAFTVLEEQEPLPSSKPRTQDAPKAHFIHTEGSMSPGVIGDNTKITYNVPKPAGRHISDSQKIHLLEKLRPFGDVKVSILTCPGGGMEMVKLHGEFLGLFRDAGWTLTSDLQSMVQPQGTGLGVAVHSQEQHPHAADALFFTLKDMGFQVEADATDKVPIDEVRLIIAPQE